MVFQFWVLHLLMSEVFFLWGFFPSIEIHTYGRSWVCIIYHLESLY